MFPSEHEQTLVEWEWINRCTNEEFYLSQSSLEAERVEVPHSGPGNAAGC